MGDVSREPFEDALDVLARHIIDRHHAYVREILPRLTGWLDRLVEQEGTRHPEFGEIRRTFRDLADTLTPHMAKEEHILFPYIHELAVAVRSGTRPPAGPFGTLLNPIRMMEADHHVAMALAERLSTLTRGYVAALDSTDLHRQCYEELARFEADLREHVHLENDVLFAGAMALEAQVS